MSMSTKVLVAIHGIGDQTAYATIQSVAAQLGNYYDIGAPIPLGRFYPAGAKEDGPEPTLMVAPPDPKDLAGFGFAEVYWAGVPRKVAGDGYVLEETKRWARTIVGRMVLRASQVGRPMPDRERVRLVTVLDEIIETIAVLERLSLLARKAGLFDFKLQDLLRDYVNDVQVVADFPTYRSRILETVNGVMMKARKLGEDPSATELYVVAHSEGSVVAFLAILEALAAPNEPGHEWIKNTRGLMTIGSPIETHHLLWPELWEKLRPAAKSPVGQIPWHNYLDFGDPIAYPLAETSAWLKGSSGFSAHLTPDETAFARAYLPGKAHNDYWQDRELFAYFLEKVVQAPRKPDAPAATKPGDKRLPKFVSYVFPYVLIAALLWIATYCLYRPVVAVVTTKDTAPSVATVLGDALGIGLLLFGITAVARIPRLTNWRRWWVVGAAGLALSMFVFDLVVSNGTKLALGKGVTSGWGDPVWDATVGVFLVASLVALVCGTASNWWPAIGARLLPLIGVIAALILVVQFLVGEAPKDLELWPIALGSLAFFYLWWVATLLFDLVFVWHRFVRHSTATFMINEICRKGYEKTRAETVVEKCGKVLQDRRVRKEKAQAS